MFFFRYQTVSNCYFLYTLHLFLDVNECENPNQCLEVQYCTNTIGGFSCQCNPGWTGPKCEQGIDCVGCF